MMQFEYFNADLLQNTALKIQETVGLITPPTGYSFGVLSALTNLEIESSTIIQNYNAVKVHTLGATLPTEESLVKMIIIKSPVIPTASEDVLGRMYLYTGATNSTYVHGFVYECDVIAENTIVFSPNVISCSSEDFTNILSEMTPDYASVVSGSMTYFSDANLWRLVGLDENGNTVVTYQQYTEDYEQGGMVFSGTFEDGDVVSFEKVQENQYYWNRVNLQPSGNVSWGGIGGNLDDQTDLKNALDEKQNSFIAGSHLEFVIVDNNLTLNTVGLATTTDLPVNLNTNQPLHTISASTSNIVLDGTTYTTYSVYQRARTENDEYPLLAKDSTSTASGTSVVSFDTQATVNHSTGTITAPNFNGLATKATADEDGNAIKTTYAKIGDTMPLDSMLVPDLDKRTPIASYEFDSSGATYKPLLRIPNNHSNPQDIPVLNAVFRITSTRTGVKTVCDCVLSSLRTTNGPLVLMRHHPGSTSSSTTGFDYVRTVYPKVLDNGYDWYFELRNPTNDSVHTKVDVYSSDTGITWIADGTISTFNSSNQNQTAVALTTNNNLMWSITMPWTVSTANSAGYINSYLNKFISGSLPVMGVSANGQSLVLLGTDKKFYPMSSTNVPIDPGFGAAILGGAVASGSAVPWTNLSSKRRTGTTEIPHNTLTIGTSCYLRCTMDASGNIYSDNYVDTQMSAGYTWLYIGQAENATTIEVNTEGSKFYTLDTNGKLTHINGKELLGGGIANIDNSTITTNASDEIQAVATVNANTAAGATNPVYDWVGTLAEYNTQDIENQHPDWICFITDDESGGDSVYTKSEVDALVAEKDDMPSATYNDLTFGASGTQYTAPENGWVTLSIQTETTPSYLGLINITAGFRQGSWTDIAGANIQCVIPVSKGDTFAIDYTNIHASNNRLIRFIYANGAL